MLGFVIVGPVGVADWHRVVAVELPLTGDDSKRVDPLFISPPGVKMMGNLSWTLFRTHSPNFRLF